MATASVLKTPPTKGGKLSSRLGGCPGCPTERLQFPSLKGSRLESLKEAVTSKAAFLPLPL